MVLIPLTNRPPDPPPRLFRRSGSPNGWRLLFDAIREERVGVAVGILVALLWTVGKVAVPWLVQLGIDRGVDGDESLVFWAAVISSAGLVSGFFTGMRRFWAFRNARRAEMRLRDRLFAHVQRLHFAFHDGVQTGDLMSRANTDLQQFQNIITIAPPDSTGNLVTVVAVDGDHGAGHPAAAGRCWRSSSLPFVNLLGKGLLASASIRPSCRHPDASPPSLAAVVEETVAGVRVVKGFGSEPVQADKLSKPLPTDVYGRVDGGVAPFAPDLPAGHGDACPTSVSCWSVLGYGGHLVLDGSDDHRRARQLQHLRALAGPSRCECSGWSVTNGQRASAAARVRISRACWRPRPLIVAPGTTRSVAALSGLRPAAESSSVTSRSGTTTSIEVRRCSITASTLTVEPGESIALVGPTGSGKTTVANLLPAFLRHRPEATILLDGVAITVPCGAQELRRAVGLVFEETFLFSVHDP